jgi:hypothetical protein
LQYITSNIEHSVTFQDVTRRGFLGDTHRNEGGRFVNNNIILSASLAVLFASTAALAQNNPSNLEKLGEF